MPVPTRPHLIVVLRATESSLVLRKFAPTGKSSSSRSPSANGPWQSAHPLVFQISRPAFALSAFWANVVVAYARDATVNITKAIPAPYARLQSTITGEFTLAANSISEGPWLQRGDIIERAPPITIYNPLIGFIDLAKQTLLCRGALSDFSTRTPSPIVLAPGLVIIVVVQAFLLRNSSMSDDACLQVDHD